MKITFLGTGTSSGVPMIGCDCATCQSDDPHDRRMRPSVFIETDDQFRLLVDAGPDLRTQALTYKIDRVDAIFFTHGHADHILGLDDVRRYNYLQRRPMPLYADATTVSDIRKAFSYAFDPKTDKGGGLPQLVTNTIEGPFCAGRQEVTPVPLFHGRRPILGLRAGGFAYLTDCSAIPESSMALLQGLDVLVIDALRDRPHPTHFTLEEAIAASRALAPGRTLFTHMCHDLPHAATCARLPPTMELAYDGLMVEC